MRRLIRRLGKPVLIALVVCGLICGSMFGNLGISPVRGAAAAPIPSWPGASTQYLGRYRLTASSDSALATKGELTIFLRVVPKVPKPALSGILSLATKTQTNVVYLTAFKHSGMKRWTTVNLGIFTGPVLGQFVVTSIIGNQLVAQLVQSGKTPISLSFTRFSSNPHP